MKKETYAIAIENFKDEEGEFEFYVGDRYKIVDSFGQVCVPTIVDENNKFICEVPSSFQKRFFEIITL